MKYSALDIGEELMQQVEVSRHEGKSDFLTVAEAARALRVSEASVRNWIKQGRIGSLNLGRLKRIRRSAFDSFLRKSENEL